MELFHSIRFRFVGLLSFFIIAMSVLMSVLGIHQMSKTVLESFSTQGITIVEKAVSMVDGDAFEALAKSLDINDPFYEETRIKLLELKELSGCLYIYTMTQVDGDIWRYIIDGSSEPDDHEKFSELGDEENTSIYDDAFRRVLISGKTESGNLAYLGEWGWVISFYAPIKNSAGKIVGIAACEFDGTALRNSINTGMKQHTAIGGISVVLCMAMTLFFLKIAHAEQDEITVMKDNLKTGIFFMDRDCIIQKHYSRYLEEMLLEKDLSGKCFTSLLSASFNEKELDTIRHYFEMLFKNSFDKNMLDEINPLGEFYFLNARTGRRKVFQCGFTTVEQLRGKKFALVTMYDVTAKTELQKQLEEQETIRDEEMKNVFELIQVEPQVFNDFFEDAEYEFGRINETFGNEAMSAHATLVEIYQSVHAVKSNAVILGLNTFGEKVHKLEAKIKKLREQEEASFEEMLSLGLELEKLSQEKDGFKATLEKINSFKSSSQHGGEYVLVESLLKTVNKVCGDMGKKVKLIVDGIDDEALEKGPRRIIKETLIQLARNSVVHGIEKPEDRVACGKDETGVIRLSVKAADGNVHVKLGDDGRGLDYRKIAEKALRMKLIKPENANDKNALLKAVFSPGFSTAETEGIHAGRGIGLSMVQDRVRSGKGFIKVQNEAGKGIVFNIFLPLFTDQAYKRKEKNEERIK